MHLGLVQGFKPRDEIGKLGRKLVAVRCDKTRVRDYTRLDTSKKNIPCNLAHAINHWHRNEIEGLLLQIPPFEWVRVDVPERHNFQVIHKIRTE